MLFVNDSLRKTSQLIIRHPAFTAMRVPLLLNRNDFTILKVSNGCAWMCGSADVSFELAQIVALEFEDPKVLHRLNTPTER